jgi:hypothetical protein
LPPAPPQRESMRQPACRTTRKQEYAMNDLERFISDLSRLLLRIGESFVAGLEAVEIALRDQLTIMGVSPPVQTVLLVLAAVALILITVRLFGGLIRFAIVVVLILLALNLLLPAFLHTQ